MEYTVWMSEAKLLRTSAFTESVYPSVLQVMAARKQSGEPTLSFEFFPPKDQASEENLWNSFSELMKVSPDYVSVTYGAGGSNRDRTLAIVERMAAEVPTIGHLTCVGATRDSSIEIIKRFEAAKVAGILALRGDSPKDDPQALAKGELKTALELVELVHEQTDLAIGVAAFPEVHPESKDLAHDAMVLKLKQDAGASFAVTQLFFSLQAYLDLIAASEAARATVPIVPGLMPISNAKQVVRMAELSGAKIPAALLAQLENASDDAEAREIGMTYSINLARELLAAGAPGLHIFSLNTHVAALELARGARLCQ